MEFKVISIEELEKISGGTGDDEAMLNNFLTDLRKYYVSYPPRLKQLIEAEIKKIIEENQEYDYFYIKSLIIQAVGNLSSGWQTGRIK